MPFAEPVTLVWVGDETPSPVAEKALEAWANKHNRKLVFPTAPEVPEPPASLGEASAACEQWLDAAREALSADQNDEARPLLARAEQGLRDYPDLPEAAWLMAERLRLGARAASRHPGWSGEALSLMRRADVLEGRRAIAYGEAAPPAPESDEPPVTVKLVVRGREHYLAFWDATPVAGSIRTLPGEHHVRLVAATGGETLWSGWVSVYAASELEIWAKPATPCTSADFESVHDGSAAALHEPAPHAPVAPHGVRCGAWAWARELRGPERATELASCNGDRCDAPLTWPNAPPLSARPDSTPEARARRWPAWATFGLVGGAGVVVTGVILLASGAFQSSSAPPATTTIYVGSALPR